MNDRLGFWIAIVTMLVTAIFPVAVVATAGRSGPFCGAWGRVSAACTDVA